MRDSWIIDNKWVTDDGKIYIGLNCPHIYKVKFVGNITENSSLIFDLNFLNFDLIFDFR